MNTEAILNTITEVKEEMESHWKFLQEKYNNDTEFKLLSTGEYIRLSYEYSYFDNIEDFIDSLSKREDAGSVMVTLGMIGVDDNDENILRLAQVVVMEKANLNKLVLTSLSKIDELKAFLKQAMTHEMGYILSNIEKYDGTPFDVGFELRNEEYKAQQEAIQKLEGIEDYRDFYIQYNKTPEEACANKRVGLVPEEMWEVENAMYKVPLSDDSNE